MVDPHSKVQYPKVAYTETKNEHLVDNQVHYRDECIWPIHLENRPVANPTHWLSSVNVRVQLFHEFPRCFHFPMGIPKTRQVKAKEVLLSV